MATIAFDYPEDIRDIRSGIARFLEAEVIPRHEKHAKMLADPRRVYAEDGRYTRETLDIIREVRMASAAAGFYGMSAPEEIGGSGYGLVAYFGAWEEVFRRCGFQYWLGHFTIGHWAKGPSRVLLKMTPEARERFLPDIMSGSASMCFGLSEPGAGSDAMAIKTRAVRDGDGWRLNGDKIWITNSPHAEFVVVFAVTNPDLAAKRKGGISTFLVPTNSPGFQVESVIKMWGHPWGDEGVLRFDDVRVEPYQLVCELDHGFRTAMLGVSLGRVYNMARAVGLARWALAIALDYAKLRHTFGKPLSEYQAIAFPLAEVATEVHAAHLMSRNAAELLDRGEPALKELSMAKYYAVEAGIRALDQSIHTHGAIGFTNEMHLTEAYLMLKKIRIADGSREILLRQVAKRLLEGDGEL